MLLKILHGLGISLQVNEGAFFGQQLPFHQLNTWLISTLQCVYGLLYQIYLHTLAHMESDRAQDLRHRHHQVPELKKLVYTHRIMTPA